MVTDHPDNDPWAAGRATTAAEVKEIFSRHRTPGPAAEHHDALPAFVRLPRFLLNKLPQRRRRAVVAGLLLLAAGAAFGIKLAYDASQRAQLREARAERAFRSGEFRRLVADQRVQTAAIGTATGPALKHRLEAAITSEARARVRAGELSGPIRRTICRQGNPLVNEGANPNLFRCLAITSSAVGVTLGHEFFVRIDPARGLAVWCHNNYPPGHPETHTVSVRVPRSCT